MIKLVNLGLPKTGTTTLAHALNQAGWLAADHRVRRIHTEIQAVAGSYVGRQLYRSYFETGDPLATLDPVYDALTEINLLKGDHSAWPQCDYVILQAMRRARPETKFVATWRPAEEISDSMLRWGNMASHRLPAANIPGMPSGFGTSDAERLRWIEGHYAMLREIFDGDDRYLELPVGADNARELLEAHTGLDLPWWGRKNVNDGTAAPDADESAA